MLTISSVWIEPLAKLGFDVLTYKTVREISAPAHAFPNCVYLPELSSPMPIVDRSHPVHASFEIPDKKISEISMANSFGMPSPPVKEWQEDIQKTLRVLNSGQILIVSVVGTVMRPGDDLCASFVRCARLANEVGPHAIELNFSCPNVFVKEEGSVFLNPELAGRIARSVRSELPEAKILVKIGYLRKVELAKFVDATYMYVNGYTGINSVPIRVVSTGQREEPAFPGSNRGKPGVSGVAIRNYALQTVKNLSEMAAVRREGLAIIGVGGISTVEDVKEFLAAGATCVQLCTAAMLNPFVAAEIRKQLVAEDYSRSHSRILGRSGLPVPFEDPTSATAFDFTLEACAELNVPFEIGYAALHKNWLAGYMGTLKDVGKSGSTQVKTRRDAPTRNQILEWVRSEANKK